MMEQIRRQRRETERMEMVIGHTECYRKAGERWRKSEKIRYMTCTKIFQDIQSYPRGKHWAGQVFKGQPQQRLYLTVTIAHGIALLLRQ